MRFRYLILGLLMVVACSCASGDVASNTTGPVSTTTTVSAVVTATSVSTTASATGVTDTSTSRTPRTTSSLPTTATAPPAALPSFGFVVASPDGVVYVDITGEATWLLSAPAAVAVDDTRGGLVYQTESGRTWDEADLNTVIWRIAARESTPRPLLVPSPGQTLTLHDVVDANGQLLVLYTLHEGHTPETAADSLRIYDVASQTISELDRIGVRSQGVEATPERELDALDGGVVWNGSRRLRRLRFGIGIEQANRCG